MSILRWAVPFLSVLALAVPTAFAQEGAWRTDPVLPNTPAYHAAVTFGESIAVIGGEIGSGPVPDVFVSSLRNGEVEEWIASEPLPQPVAQAAAIVSGQQVLLIGGWNGRSVLRNVYRATVRPDGRLSGWTSLADLVPEARRGAVAVVRDNTVFYIGGEDVSGKPTDTVFVARLTAVGLTDWRQVPSLPEPLTDSSVHNFGDWLILTGGRNTKPVASTYVLPPGRDGPWEQRASLPYAVERPAGAIVNGRLVLAGGGPNPSDSAIASRLLPDGVIGAWAPLPNLPEAKIGASLVAHNGTVYLLGGFNGVRYLNSVSRLVFDPPVARPTGSSSSSLIRSLPTTLPDLPFVPALAIIAIGSLAVAVVLLVRERLTTPTPDEEPPPQT